MTATRTLVAATLLWAAGCQGGGPPAAPDGVAASGKVLLPGGAPLTGGTLILRPVGGVHGATARVQKDGTFALADSAGDKKVVPGKYQVFVRFNDPSEKALQAAVNKRYQDTEDGDSDVTVEITAATADLVIRLNR